MELQITWFILWAVLWAVYFMLDGFVQGTGMLSGLLGKSDRDKRMLLAAVGPVWNGNEVWLITAGGATFAAFPTAYAVMFSALYTALLLLLLALIIRGVSFEFRGLAQSRRWRRLCDLAVVVSTFLPALLFGVAFGNIFRGLPLDAAGYHGSFPSLLNPYGLMTGALFVLLFAVHGALYAAVKTEGALSERAQKTAIRLWWPLLVVAVAFLGYSAVETQLLDNYLRWPVLALLPLAAVAALAAIRYFSAKGAWLWAFGSSCATVLFVTFTGTAGLFPNLIPSSLDPAYSLTITNSSSSQYTLAIMTAVALVLVPVVIAYKIWVYRVFRARIAERDLLPHGESY